MLAHRALGSAPAQRQIGLRDDDQAVSQRQIGNREAEVRAIDGQSLREPGPRTS
jgi:hypothetical protein